MLSGGTASVFADAGLAASANVRHLGFVGDDDLAALFARALCFAFPSRTEGFGIPLLEAMVHGCPIIAADGASMPEVCGDAALSCRPTTAKPGSPRIAALAGSEPLRADLRAKGLRRYPLFSWARSADAYLDLALALSPRTTTARAGAAPLRDPSTATARVAARPKAPRSMDTIR